MRRGWKVVTFLGRFFFVLGQKAITAIVYLPFRLEFVWKIEPRIGVLPVCPLRLTIILLGPSCSGSSVYISGIVCLLLVCTPKCFFISAIPILEFIS